MTKLSVNVNKLATLRNSRGKNLPDVLALSEKILGFGVHGLTVHPRPDGRHIRPADVAVLSQLVRDWNLNHPEKMEFNVEGYPSRDYLDLINTHRPHQATLVPDPPEALTSNAGWDLVKEREFLKDVVNRLRETGTRVSLFVDPFTFSADQENALIEIKPDRIELYTEKYADHFHTPERDSVTQVYQDVARRAKNHGIGVNAGHDLNQENLRFLVERIPWLEEVSIGHALICEALEAGLERTVKSYLKLLKEETNEHSHVKRA